MAARRGTPEIHVVFLGTGTPSGAERACAAYALRLGAAPPTILLDTSGGHELLRQLHLARIPLPTIRHVVVTHEHGDHAKGLDFLLFALRIHHSPGPPVWVHCPADGMDAIRALAPAARDVRLADRVRWRGLALGQAVELEGVADGADGDGPARCSVSLTCTRAAHAVPAMGCVLDIGGRRVGYTGDTAPFDDLLSGTAYRGVDLLLHDAFGLERDGQATWRTAHCTAAEAGRSAAAAGVGRVALVHIRPSPGVTGWRAAALAEAATHFGGPIIAPDDLEQVALA